MNDLLRRHGFGVALIVGIVLAAAGLLGARLDALILGGIFLLVGVVARPIEEAQWSLTSGRLKWQRDVARLVGERLEGSIKPTGELEVKKIPGAGKDATVNAGIAKGTGSANAAAAIVRPQSPEEFAETLVDKVIAPIVVTPGTARLRIEAHPAEVRVSDEPNTPPDTTS